VLAGTVDLAIAVDHMTLRATELGLGTCWIGAFDQQEVKKVLGIPEGVTVIAVMPVGYPAESKQPTPRKPLEEIICYERWA
jgi:nitroreductase